MMKLCVGVASFAGGYAAWALGEAVGLGFMSCFLLSGVGSIVGVYVGWKLGRRLG